MNADFAVGCFLGSRKHRSGPHTFVFLFFVPSSFFLLQACILLRFRQLSVSYTECEGAKKKLPRTREKSVTNLHNRCAHHAKVSIALPTRFFSFPVDLFLCRLSSRRSCKRKRCCRRRVLERDRASFFFYRSGSPSSRSLSPAIVSLTATTTASARRACVRAKPSMRERYERRLLAHSMELSGAP